MIPITHPTDEQFPLLDALSSSVFLSHKPGESMMRRYSALMGKENREHINIICEDGKPVSNVNWYPVRIALGDSILTAGQVGGVCSHPSVRGKGYADALLQYSFEQMKKEGDALCVISGDRGLYLRNGARHFIYEYPFLFDEPLHQEGVSYLPPDRLSEGADAVYRWHSQTNPRILRSKERICELLLAFGESHHGYRGHLYYSDSAYVVVSVSSDMQKPIVVTEFDGLPEAVIEIFGEIVFRTGKGLEGHCMAWQKEAYSSLSFQDAVMPEMTMRLIDPVLLFEQLAPYFASKNVTAHLASNEDGTYVLTIEGEEHILSEEDLIHALFFGSDWAKDIFPLPLPDFHTMDYQ